MSLVQNAVNKEAYDLIVSLIEPRLAAVTAEIKAYIVNGFKVEYHQGIQAFNKENAWSYTMKEFIFANGLRSATFNGMECAIKVLGQEPQNRITLNVGEDQKTQLIGHHLWSLEMRRGNLVLSLRNRPDANDLRVETMTKLSGGDAEELGYFYLTQKNNFTATIRRFHLDTFQSVSCDLTVKSGTLWLFNQVIFWLFVVDYLGFQEKKREVKAALGGDSWHLYLYQVLAFFLFSHTPIFPGRCRPAASD